jgi:hypothetical protein
MVIQRLLAEAGAESIPGDLVSVEPGSEEAQADWDTLGSPETYLGLGRGTGFEAPDGPRDGRYDAPATLELNHWGLSGDWSFEAEGIALNEDGGRIAIRFHARDVNLVMGPPMHGATVRFRVLLDGDAPAAAAGEDIDGAGDGLLAEQRMHQLIRQRGPIVDRRLEIEFLDRGAEAFVFTFG